MSLLDQFRMDGQVAVVTGSGQGIGRGIAWGLADAGCDVVINARRQEDLDVTAAGIEERGRRAAIFCADIIDRSDDLADFTIEQFGRLDTWVNNVGGSNEKRTWALADTPDDVFRSQLELNLTSAFQGVKAAVKHLPEGGSIINIASGAGMRGSPFTGPYAAAKAGMLNMTDTQSVRNSARHYWNAGVYWTFSGLAETPTVLKDYSKQGYDYVAKQIELANAPEPAKKEKSEKPEKEEKSEQKE